LSDEADWTYGGPFSGTIKNGAIYGRGAMDMKGMLFALMDAAEMLMQKGFVPQRDIYFAFGPDGEVGGANGSGPISLFLKEMGIQLETVFNEGGMIIKIPANNQVYGMAVIGIAEKGLLSLQINVRNKGGLSAMPDSDSAWGNAAIIMQRLENKQMKARILPEIDVIMRSVGYMMDFKYRFIIANKYIFENILLNALSRNPMTNAIIRTTTALTQAQGGSLNAVLPLVARVVVNFRLLPGDTADDVIKHVTEASQGFDVTLTKLEHRNPSRFSSTTSSAFDKIVAAIREIYPTANILPYVTIDGTDASNYEIVADNVYRFMPVAVTLAQQSAMHNADEHISINNYLRMVMYFETLMRNYDAQ
jgi:carboxypeptidase PM20D1